MASAAEPRHLIRALTVVPAAAVIIANVIGTGVFVKARVMTVNVGSPWTVMIVWVVAGVLTMAGALVYAELSAMMPRAGGEYNFLGAAYGRACAFYFSWTRILASTISHAAIAILFATFLNDLLGGALPKWAWWAVPILVIAIATLLNALPTKDGGRIATVITAIKIVMMLAIGIGAFALADGTFGHLSGFASGDVAPDVPESARGGVAGFGAAMLGALWAYNGWNILGYLGGEVKEPARTLPRALIGSALLIIGFYLFLNFAYFYVLTPQEVAGVAQESSVAVEVATRFLGRIAASLIAIGLLISAYGTLHMGFLAVTRLPYALARDGLLPARLSWLSRVGVPVVSVLAMGAISAALTLVASFDQLTDIYVFVLWIFYALTTAAVFVLRRRYPDAPRPYRVWGYPVVPALFLLAAAFLLANTFVATPIRALAGVGVIALGLPVYLYYAPRAPKHPIADWLETRT